MHIEKKQDPLFIVIDLFCGFGGVTTGFCAAVMDGNALAKVIACINHDPKAILSHWKNYPGVKHYEEDIRTLNLRDLTALVKKFRKMYPNAKVILWASLECTHFSKAKGGGSRLEDSRTLATSLYKKYNPVTKKYSNRPSYMQCLKPDYLMIENVSEFLSWAPLRKDGTAPTEIPGKYFKNFRKQINKLGYHDQWTELNSADFGAYTSRTRLFGCFAKGDLPIIWPKATHAKEPEKAFNAPTKSKLTHKKNMLGDWFYFPTGVASGAPLDRADGEIKKWMPVKHVLNFEDEGQSIFTREKPLVDNTLKRIYAGLLKFVANGDDAFISKYFSGRPAGKVNSVEYPGSSITTFGGGSLVQPEFLLKYNSRSKNGKHVPPSIQEPSPVLSTQDRIGLVQPKFLTLHYSGGGQLASVDDPSPTIATKDRMSIVTPEYFIDKHYGKMQNQSIHEPAGTIVTNDKHRLVQCEHFVMPTNYNNGPKSIEEPSPVITANRKHHYLVNPQFNSKGSSIENPCFTLIAKMDKRAPSLVVTEKGEYAIAVNDGDTATMIQIKQFMAAFGIVDIKMRMLRVPELMRIQGLPEKYKMVGSQQDHKKFIGNSVVPVVVTRWIEALAIPVIGQEDTIYNESLQKRA